MGQYPLDGLTRRVRSLGPGQPVIDPPAIAPKIHQPRARQNRQVPRNRRGRQAHQLVQLANAPLPRRQGAQEAQAVGVGEGS
jgi:hypothetical protein